jgi:hypothetical protein
MQSSELTEVKDLSDSLHLNYVSVLEKIDKVVGKGLDFRWNLPRHSFLKWKPFLQSWLHTDFLHT